MARFGPETAAKAKLVPGGLHVIKMWYDIAKVKRAKERIIMGNIGFRIFSAIERPSPDLVRQFADIPVANLADNMGRIPCADAALRPFNEVPLLGVAFTVKVPQGDNLMIHKAIDMAAPGDVIVVDAEGDTNRSLCGEIMFTYAKSRGIAGFVVDGAIRDVSSLKEMDFPVFARAVHPNGPYKNGPGEIGAPVCIGGRVVCPGDIVLGDADGIVFIRPDDALEALEKGRAQNEMEKESFLQIAAGTYDRSWIDKVLAEKGCEVVE